uniref:EAL domain-containing protein n=1 Tax=Thermodesulfobacterium geofontis TaxID=1295609 RepID=A0A7V6CD97_9BACT
MNINLRICSCQREKLDLWENFSENFKNLLNKEVNFSVFEKFPQDLEEEIDLFFVSPSLSLHLIEKNYKPVAKFKNQIDSYLILSPKSLSELKDKEKIRVIIPNRAIFFLHLFYFIVSKANLDFSKIQIILKNSQEEVEAEILNNQGEIYILKEKRAKPYLDKFLLIEKFPFALPHYFILSSENPFFNEINTALFSIDKNVIKALGFKEIEEVNIWEENLIKFFSNISKIFPQLIEKCTILDTFLNAPFFGIAIYHKTYLYVNPYFCELLGYTPEELKKLAVWEMLYYEEDKERIKKVAERRLKGEYFFSTYLPVALKAKDGRKIDTLIFASTIFYQNKYCGFVVGVDVSELKKLQKFLNLLRHVNQILIHCSYEEEIYEKILPILYKTLELKAVWISDEKGEILYSYPEDFRPSKNLIISTTEKSVQTLNINSYSLGIVPLIKKGNIIATLNLLSSEKGFFSKDVLSMLIELQQDLNFALKKVELVERDLSLGKLVEKSEELTIIADEKGRIEYINPIGEEILGFKKEELSEKNCFKLLFIPEEIIKQKIDTTRFVIYHTPDKFRVILELKISFIKLPTKTKVIIVGRDLTKELEFEKERELLQYQDPLTGLPNPQGFQKKLTEFLNIFSKPSTLILIDFYKFSYINHFYGYETGNYCLKELAKRLQNAVKDKGFLGRTGGDEFCLFLMEVTGEKIREWIKNLESILKEPISYQDKKISLDWNMGIVVFPQDGNTVDELRKKINLALVEAKEKGPSNIEIYNPEIERKVEKVLKLELIIKSAFEKELFVFYYQPYFETETLKLAGAEALVRIKKNKELILPNEFITFLENSPYLPNFELLSLKKNIEKIKKWKIPISINISSQSFKSTHFLNLLTHYKEILSQYPYFLEIEITEHTLAEHIDMAKEIIETIKSFKAKISLDDFGTGFSSLNYLKDFPIDIIKIDLSFTRDLVKDVKTYYIVESFINLSRSLNIKTLAEGVETEEQLKLLKKLKCDYVQGYLLAKPLPEEEIEKLLK